jgi:glycosyltransferase involved in cell wall biosynthesis
MCHGGITSWLLLQGRALRRLGVDVIYWFGSNLSTRREEFERLGPVHWGSAASLYKTLLAGGGCDVLHLVNRDPTAEILGLFRPGLKVLVTSHGDLSESWNSRNCFAYTAVSPDLAVLNQPLTDLEVELVPNGVDCDQLTPPTSLAAGAPVVAWAGRSRDLRKDFPRFTRIAAHLVHKGVRLWVADAHAASAADFAQQDCPAVRFDRWERVPYDAMPHFYREVAASGGLMLMTSRQEGWGLVASEAAACGAYTLAADVVGLRNAIRPGVTGDLYPADAPDADVAERVLQCLTSRRPKMDRIEACADMARAEFSADVMARRYLEIYARPEQRLYGGAAIPWDPRTPGLPGLVHRLKCYRFERAASLSRVAASIAREGHPTVAWRALRRAWRLAPSYFARPRRLIDQFRAVKVIFPRMLGWRR